MNTINANIDAIVAWYTIHAKEILMDNDKADEAYDVLKRAEELHIIERLNSLKRKRKEHNWELIFKAVSLGVGLLFNVFLVGCIFRYESFAPIITKCFGFVRPMPI